MRVTILFVFLIFCMGCGFGAGTLGGFDERVFSTSKQKLVKALDSLYYNHPEYKIPAKWQHLDDWKERGYDFLDSRIFYFKSKPEEMYYVSFIGMPDDSVQNNKSASIAIRAVNDSTSGWLLEKNTSWSEKRRIEKRFDDEIITKLEQFTGTKAVRER